VLLKLFDGSSVLVDNGIGQFEAVPHTHAVWIWIDRSLLE
jgi:hypothetical protein